VKGFLSRMRPVDPDERTHEDCLYVACVLKEQDAISGWLTEMILNVKHDGELLCDNNGRRIQEHRLPPNALGQ